ncbi:DEAD/DEAH box helicase [Azospirillum sp. sgz302134]
MVSSVSAGGASLEEFQERAVTAMVGIIQKTISTMAQAESARRRIALSMGTILLQAPTGAGKTLMMSETLARADRVLRSEGERVVWFWFAPFTGLIEQTADAIRRDCPTLRVRDVRTDRHLARVRRGDTFVLNWQTVAARNAQSRVVRTDAESAPSLDLLIEALRVEGWRIGCVVDEAHHGFRPGTEACRFYTQVLKPDVTILATATPRDRDVEAFCRLANIPPANLNTISVARNHVVETRLNKRGVRAVAFKPYQKDAALIDTAETAVDAALAHHRLVKRLLLDNGITLTPLLLIQVEDGDRAIPAMRRFLVERGVPESVIAEHSAKEPDRFLHTLAFDESKEVLIFKVAVATGFDAPRAFTLASTRTNRGHEFGLQIIGRIMRVHPRLRHRTDLPAELEYGYVFLALLESQTGLASAAAEIGQVRDEIRTVADDVIVFEAASGPDGVTVIAPGEDGFKGVFDSVTGMVQQEARPQALTSGAIRRFGSAGDLFGSCNELFADAPSSGNDSPKLRPQPPASHVYRLRSDLEFPRVFQTEMVPSTFMPLADAVAARVHITDGMMMFLLRQYGRVQRIETDLFEEWRTTSHEDALLSPTRLARESQHAFEFSDRIDPRQVRRALLERLRREAAHRRLAEPSEQDLRRCLDLILAENPRLIAAACRVCMGEVVEVRSTEPLPEAHYAPFPLDPSRLNVYGIYPQDLNTWERPFAELLDEDTSGIVRWWHRNVPHRGHSIAIIKADGHPYFPDFVVGVEGMANTERARLVEVKERINDDRNEIANRSRHKSYGSALMVRRDPTSKRWQVVKFLEGTGTNVPDRDFEHLLLRTWV